MSASRRYWAICTPLDAASMTQFANACEAAGLEGIWGIQLYGPPFIPLAAAAMVSKRLKLGTGVALAFTRSPLETALSAMDIDTISGGRMVLGLGTSLRWWNESWHGVRYGKPIAHLRELIMIVRKIIAEGYTGQIGKIEGENYRLDLTGFRTLVPPVRERIPIYVPAVFQSSVKLAGEIADGLAGHPIWSAHWIRNEVNDTLTEALQKAGRKRSALDLNIWAWVAIDEDRRKAIDASRGTVAFYASMEQYEKYFAAHGFGPKARAAYKAAARGDTAGMIAAVPDEMVTTFAIAGTSDEVRERVEALWQIADSMTLAAPAVFVEPTEAGRYRAAIAETFYGT